MRISDWSSDVCSSDLYVYCATGSLAGSPSLRIGIASSRGERGLVGGPCMDRLQPADGRRATRVEPGAVARGFEREAHHDVGGGRSEEHTSELQSLMRISYAVFCLKKKKKQQLKEMIAIAM